MPSAAGNGGDDADYDSSDDIEILMTSPLSSAAIFKSGGNALENLQRFVSSIVSRLGEEMDVEVNRKKDILSQILRKYKNPAFDLRKPLNVTFVDECGLDGRGLTREFFHILMRTLQKPSGPIILFEGLDGHLVPMHNYDALSSGLFVLVGKIIVHSVLNNCKGMPGFSPAIVAYLVSGNRDASIQHVTLEDIPDPVLQGN